MEPGSRLLLAADRRDAAIAEGWANIPHIEPNGFRVGVIGFGGRGSGAVTNCLEADDGAVAADDLQRGSAMGG